MPNHVHGIIVINDARCRDVARNVSTTGNDNVFTIGNGSVAAKGNLPLSAAMSTISPKAGSLGAIVRSYKSAVTRWCGMNGYPFFDWQERYFDEIIWDEQGLNRIRAYIANNPANWDKDKENLAGLRM